MRLDKYLKVSRIIKRRTVANEVCDAGHVSVSGRVVKASYDVNEGDILEIQFGEKITKYKVLFFLSRKILLCCNTSATN